ncbi:polysaccharide deacetylase family protein [Kitasatospora sp. RG8]|uniref:polysaccharide deacetylase family protein n=1 Tax=Kitasatospora sp. RG8 TaxID=2820815 RepID=UPI001AE0C00A|nr:polysaccharide deacetylase family protein [Kitasatospora sp. RG8]MBP0448912.1 polysaccharide deacetylase family protein [Kitasatospora sp. RG8]
MLSDRQITSRRLLLVAAGMSLLGVAGCRGSQGADEGGGGSGAEAAGGASGTPGAVAPPASASGSAPPSASGVPSAAPSAGPSSAPPAAPGAAAGVASGSPVAAPRKLTAAESRPVYELDAERRVVALTIDDGPDPRYTPTVLALLEQYGIRATFFLIGENAVDHAGLVKEIAARGHHIANHTWTHPDLRRLSETQVRDELTRTSDLLNRTTGKLPTWFRAPGGDWSTASLTVAADLGMRNMAWSVDPRDWARPGTSVITDRILKDVRPGAIVLNHDGGGDRSQTVAALKAYLPVLIDAGYYFTAPPG